VHEYDPLVWAPDVLDRLRLAPLPKSARNIRMYVCRVFMAAEDFLRFEADPNDIERFLAGSPGLAYITPAPLSELGEKRTRTVAYYNSSAPAWYDQTLPDRTRCYNLNAPGGGTGEIFVHDERHAVYVYWGK
jgi:hypothetical protein